MRQRPRGVRGVNVAKKQDINYECGLNGGVTLRRDEKGDLGGKLVLRTARNQGRMNKSAKHKKEGK